MSLRPPRTPLLACLGLLFACEPTAADDPRALDDPPPDAEDDREPPPPLKLYELPEGFTLHGVAEYGGLAAVAAKGLTVQLTPSAEEPGAEPPAEEYFPPASLEVLVYQVEFSTDGAGCTDPVLIGEPDDPRYVDFSTAPELMSADVPPAGTYPCIIITMSDHILWSVDGDNPCAGAHEQDVYRDGGSDGVEETVRLYLSTQGAVDDDASDPFSAPGTFLDGALEAGDDALSSTFVISFPNGVRMRTENGVTQCELQKPDFGFVSSP